MRLDRSSYLSSSSNTVASASHDPIFGFHEDGLPQSAYAMPGTNVAETAFAPANPDYSFINTMNPSYVPRQDDMAGTGRMHSLTKPIPESKSLYRIAKQFRHLDSELRTFSLQSDVFGNKDMATTSWAVSMSRGARNWYEMEKVYHHKEEQCTSPVSDPTFPCTQVGKDRYAQRLFNALVDWRDYTERKRTGMRSNSFRAENEKNEQMTILGQVLTPLKTECLCFLLLVSFNTI